MTGEVRHRELLPHRFVVAWIDSFFMEEDSKPECMRDGEFMLIWSETSLKLGLIGCIVVLVLEYAEVTTGLPEVILASTRVSQAAQRLTSVRLRKFLLTERESGPNDGSSVRVFMQLRSRL